MLDVKPLVVSDLNPPLKPTLVRNTEGLQLVKGFLAREKEFGFDVETNVAETFSKRKLRTIQIGNRLEQYVIDLLAFAGSTEGLMMQGNWTAPEWATEIIETIKPALESFDWLKLGQNLQFDYEAVRWCLGLRPFNFYDTLLAEKAIYNGIVRFTEQNFWALDDLVRRYCKLEIDKTHQTSFNLVDELTPEQVAYAALDTRFPFSIRNGQLPTLKKAGLLRVLEEVEFPAIMPFGDMHLKGFFLNPVKWRIQIDVITKEHEKRLAAMDEQFIKAVGSKNNPPVLDLDLEISWRNEKDKKIREMYRKVWYAHRKIVNDFNKALPKWRGEACINYGSPAQVLAALKKLGVKLTDTNDSTLENIDHPAVNALREFRTTEKLLDSFGESFLEYIDPDTGRVHSNIQQWGAETGRTTSASPNQQNIPKEEEGSVAKLRSCYEAPQGYVLITRDYDGCELRFLAEFSDEGVWIQAFNEGKDVHSVCTEIMYPEQWKAATEPNCSYVASGKKCKCKGHKKLRGNAKEVTFGIPYGKGVISLAKTLKISKEDGQVLMDVHASRFPKVHKYLNESGGNAKISCESRTPSGRRRLFEKVTWELATRIATKKLEEAWTEREKKRLQEANKGKASKDKQKIGPTPRFTPTGKQVQKTYYGLYGSIEREGKNTPIQGGNADIVKLAMALCWKDEKWTNAHCDFVSIVHDELVAECPEEFAEEMNKFIADKMEEAGKVYVKKVRMISDGGFGPCWAK